MPGYEEYLDKIWHDPKHPASYSGPTKLYRAVKAEGRFPNLGLARITKWLAGQEEYSIQRSLRKGRDKLPGAYIEREGMMMELDLMQLSSINKQNNGMNYVICIVDVFSKKLYTEAVKNKDGNTIANATEKMLTKSGWPKILKTDRGGEFTSRKMTKLLKDHNVKQIFSENETKAMYVERAIQSLKNRIFRYFTKHQSYRYIDRLKDFTDSYNKTYHRVIGMAPADVNKSTRLDAWYNMYIKKFAPKREKVKKEEKPKKKHRKRPQKVFKYKVGDHVRVSYVKSKFARSYQQKWSDEIFTVKRRYTRDGVPVYKLQDSQGSEITGVFYHHEMQIAITRPDQTYRISHIVKTRKRKGQEREMLIHWYGWPVSARSWVKESDIEDIKQDQGTRDNRSKKKKKKVKPQIKGK